MADLRRDFWIRKTGRGQQVTQLYDRYMMMIYTLVVKPRTLPRIKHMTYPLKRIIGAVLKTRQIPRIRPMT
jgi:hypothetical protein